jgi:hypothetical protein
MVSALAAMAVLMYASFRVIKKWSSEPAEIVIAADTLFITNLGSGATRNLPFAAIAAYRHSSFNSDDILRLTLRDGSKTKLVVSGIFQSGQGEQFAAMVQELEGALG